MSFPTPPLLLELPADPHSYAATGSLRAQHLRLDLTVDFACRTLAGTATWLLAGGPVAVHGELVLDTRGLLLEAVQLGEAANGPSATYHLAPANSVLGQALHIEVPAGTGAVRISYRTRPEAAALQWLAPAQTAGAHPFLFTQSQAILARTWLPCPDSPGLRFSYEAKVEVLGAERGQLLALMSAENPQATAADGRYAFRQPQPVPAYLLALAVGRHLRRARYPTPRHTRIWRVKSDGASCRTIVWGIPVE